MERLTYFDGGRWRLLADGVVYAGFPFVDRLAAYENTGLSPEEVTELALARKDGRLVVLPCKIGDVVYESNKRGFISTYKVISIRISYCSVLIGWELIDGIYSNLNGFEASALGKTVFLTRAEAEAALERRKEARHDQRRPYPGHERPGIGNPFVFN